MGSDFKLFQASEAVRIFLGKTCTQNYCGTTKIHVSPSAHALALAQKWVGLVSDQPCDFRPVASSFARQFSEAAFGKIMDDSPGTNAYDHLMKILIIGDSGSNKRRLLAKYLQDEDLTDTTTLGVRPVESLVAGARLSNSFQPHHMACTAGLHQMGCLGGWSLQRDMKTSTSVVACPFLVLDSRMQAHITESHFLSVCGAPWFSVAMYSICILDVYLAL